MDGWLEYVILVVLVLINAFFAASELAIVSARKSRMKQLSEEGNRQARSVLRLSDNPRRFLATIQVGVTLSGFFASAFGAVSLVRIMENVFREIPFLTGAASTLAFIVVTVLIAFITLIFGELVPKTLAIESADKIALVTARPIELIAKIAAPVVAFLTGTTNLVVRLLGVKRSVGTQSVTSEEILSMVMTGQEEGVFAAKETEILRGAIEFKEKRVREVMIPRPDTMFLNARQTVAQAVQEILEGGYSRYPIYDGTHDNVVGVVYTKDILRVYSEAKQNDMPVEAIAKKPFYVPESKNIAELFNELQKSRVHMAIVVDEYGGIAGIITLEDLLEELVGEIQDEFDHEDENFIPVGENEYVVKGGLPLYELEEKFGIDLEHDQEGERIGVDTIAGFVMERLRYVPRQGDRVREILPGSTAHSTQQADAEAHAGTGSTDKPVVLELTVQEMKGLRVDKIRLKLEYYEATNSHQPTAAIPAQTDWS
jgi:putative hemolysin